MAMARWRTIRAWLPWAAMAGFALALRLCPPLAAGWTRALSRPALLALNRLTAALPFPLAEPAALLLAAKLLRDALSRQGRSFLRTLLALAFGYALLWLPPSLASPAPAYPAPDAARLEALCDALVDALVDAPPGGELPEVLARAPDVAGLPGTAVKAARYPEWMRARHIAGLFVPWTGEALVDGAAHPALVPFTAVHELAHLSGLADEGAANVAAWQRCLAAGEPFAASARLWALRYAAGLLSEADPAALSRCLARMGPGLSALWQAVGGPLSPEGGYHRLALWLMSAENPPASADFLVHH